MMRDPGRLAGPLMLAMTLLAVLHGLWPSLPLHLSGAAGWAAMLLLLPNIGRHQRYQAVAMIVVGAAGLAWAGLQGGNMRLGHALSGHAMLLAMLIAVSFVRLVALPRSDQDERLPQGRGEIWRTLLGVHLFGAAINFTALVIMGDRLALRRPLSLPQAQVLARGFSAAAHWSPFFAAMAVALTNAPGSSLGTLAPIGVAIALVALGLGGSLLARQPESARFYGYPMHFEALTVPALLTTGVLAVHWAFPTIPILAVIALLALSVTVGLLWIRPDGARRQRLAEHVNDGLPRMAGELVLFLAAGVLAAGVASTIATSYPDLAVSAFGPTEATVLLLAMTVASLAGIHPVITIAVAGGALGPWVTDPNLLGITFLMAWAAGVVVSPFSVLLITLQGRYGIGPLQMIRANTPYVLLMLAVDAVALQLYAAWS